MAVIVAAEDDADVAGMLMTTLSRAGHTVHMAGTGPRALHMVAQFHPDLVILDHTMPGMTGLSVGRRLRADADTADLPLLMLSAAVPDEAPEVFNQVLHKPVPLRRVADAAGALLSASRPHPVPGRSLTDPERLSAVAALLGDPDPVDELDLAMLVANIAETIGVRTAAAKLVLNDAVLTLASVGLPDLVVEAGGMPVEWTPSAVTAGTDRPVVSPDLRADPVYRDIAMATICGIRSYASVPLHDRNGFVIGVLAAMDPEPGRLPGDVAEVLNAAAPAVMDLVDRRRD